MIMDHHQDGQIPCVDDLSLEYLDEIEENVILDRMVRNP